MTRGEHPPLRATIMLGTIRNVALSLLLAMALVLPADSANAYTTADYDAVFNWAETQYPSLFSPATTPSQTGYGYYYRYYKNTGVYLGVSGSHAYLLIPGQPIVDLGDFGIYYAAMQAALNAPPTNALSISVNQLNCIVRLSCNKLIATATGGTPPYHFQSDTFANGAPPMGTIIDLNGNLTGTPSVVGSNTVGVCVVDMTGTQACQQTNVAILDLAGTWTGSWSKTSTGGGGCTYNDSGSLSLTISSTGSTLSGSVDATGIQLRYIPSCDYAFDTSVLMSSVTGTVSGATLDISYTLYVIETGVSTPFHWTATLTNNRLVGTLVSTTGSTGSFTLMQQ